MTPVDTLIAEWPLEFNVALMACTFVAAMALLAYGVRILYTSGSILQALAFGTLAFIVLALGGTLLARNGVLHQNLTPAPVSNSAQPGSQEPTSSPVYQCVTPLTPAEQATVNRTRPETPPASAQPVCVLDSTGTRTRVLRRTDPGFGVYWALCHAFKKHTGTILTVGVIRGDLTPLQALFLSHLRGVDTDDRSLTTPFRRTGTTWTRTNTASGSLSHRATLPSTAPALPDADHDATASPSRSGWKTTRPHTSDSHRSSSSRSSQHSGRSGSTGSGRTSGRSGHGRSSSGHH